MTIRPAMLDDLPALMDLAHLMHAESRFAEFPLSEHRTAQTFARLMAADDGAVLVLEGDDGQIVGGVMGAVTDHWSLGIRVAGELAVFLTPEARRGTAAVRIVRAFEAWATERGASSIDMGITTGVHTERTGQLYERMGFAFKGMTYTKGISGV